MHLRNSLRILKLHRRRPQITNANRQQNHAQRQRSRRLKALMPIRVFRVRVLLARAVGQQQHKVRQQIGQAMLPSAIRPCDFATTPTTICAVDSTAFTATLTHVEREAADERSAAEIVESLSFSSLVSEKGMR